MAGVTNGQAADQITFNAAFLAKNGDDSTVGKVGLLDPDSTNSGGTIANAQRQINENNYAVFAVEAIGAAGEVSSNVINQMQRRNVASSGGALSASITPFGTSAGWPDGTIMRLKGDSDSNTIKFTHNDNDHGMILTGDAVLEKHRQLTVEWDNDELRWYEISRNF